MKNRKRPIKEKISNVYKRAKTAISKLFIEMAECFTIEEDFIYFTSKGLKVVHRIAANEGIRYEPDIDYICYEIKKKKYETLEDKAGFLLYQIAGRRHPFVNGNKRLPFCRCSCF
ncbi:MAG: hypothetical protein ACE5K4_04345 [Candidatus Hydrothermarchaeota archaeon]